MHLLLRLQRAAARQANLVPPSDTPPDSSSSSSPSQAHSSEIPPCALVCKHVSSRLKSAFFKQLPPYPDYYLPPHHDLTMLSASLGVQQQHQNTTDTDAVEPWRTMSSSAQLTSHPMFNSASAPAVHHEGDRHQHYYEQQPRPVLSNAQPSQTSTSFAHSTPFSPLVLSAPMPPASPSSYHDPSSSYAPLPHGQSDNNNMLFATKLPIPPLSLSLSSASSSPRSPWDAFNSPLLSSPIINTGMGGHSATGAMEGVMSSCDFTSRPGSAGMPFSKSPSDMHAHIESGNAHTHYQPHPLDPYLQPLQPHEHQGHQHEQYTLETHPFTVTDFSIQASALMPIPPLANLSDPANQVPALNDVMQHSACLPPAMQPLGGLVSGIGGVDVDPTSLSAQVGGVEGSGGPAETMDMEFGTCAGTGVGGGVEDVTIAPSSTTDVMSADVLEAILKFIDTPADLDNTIGTTTATTAATVAQQGAVSLASISGEIGHARVTTVPSHDHQEHQRNPNTNIDPQQNWRGQPIIHTGVAPSSLSYHAYPHSGPKSTIPNNPGTEVTQSQTPSTTITTRSRVVALEKIETCLDTPRHTGNGNTLVVAPWAPGPALVSLGPRLSSQQNQDSRRRLQAQAYASSRHRQDEETMQARAAQMQVYELRQQQQHQAIETVSSLSDTMTVSPVAAISPTQFQFQVPSSPHTDSQLHQQQLPPAPSRVQSTSAIGDNATGTGTGSRTVVGRRRGWSTSSSFLAGTKRKRGAGANASGGAPGGVSLSVSVPTSPTSLRPGTSASATTVAESPDDEDGEDDDDDEDDEDYEDGSRKKRLLSTSVASAKGSLGSAPRRKPRKRAITLAAAPSAIATQTTATTEPRPASAGNGATTATATASLNTQKRTKTPTLTTASGRPIRAPRSSSGRQSFSPSSTAAGPGGNSGLDVNRTAGAGATTSAGGEVGPVPRKRRCELCRRLKTKCTYAPEIKKCTTCAERGDNVLCVLVEHGSAIRAKAKAQQQQSILVASSTQMDANLPIEGALAQRPPPVPAAAADDNAADNSVPEGYAPPSVIIQRIVSPEEVKSLFRIFFERMNPYIVILDEKIHTVPHVLVRYPLVFAAVCAVASRFFTSRPDLHDITTSLALKSLGPYLAVSNNTTTNVPPPSADASIALAILALWAAPRRSMPSPLPASAHGDREADTEVGETNGPQPSSMSVAKYSSTGVPGDDRHAWSACALRMAETVHAATLVTTARSPAVQQALHTQKGGDESTRLASAENPLTSPVRVLAICHAVDHSVRLNFGFTTSVTSSSSYSSSSSPVSSFSSSAPAKEATNGAQQQQLPQFELDSEADRAARAMAQLLRLMNPNGAGTAADQNASIQSCAVELDGVLHALVAAQRGHLCATPATPPPLAYTNVAVQASFYRLVAYALQIAPLDSDEFSELTVDQSRSRFGALLGQAIDHACGTLQMVYETTGASEGLLRYASEPMLAKVLSIGLCLVHTLRLVLTDPTVAVAEDTPASRIISQLHILIEHFRSTAIDDSHSLALYSRLLSETLRASMNVSPNHVLTREQRKHMLLQLPYFLLQKALWPLGTSGRSIRST